MCNKVKNSTLWFGPFVGPEREFFTSKPNPVSSRSVQNDIFVGCQQLSKNTNSQVFFGNKEKCFLLCCLPKLLCNV